MFSCWIDIVSRISSAISSIVIPSSASPSFATFMIFTAYRFFVLTCVASFTTANPPVPRTFPNEKSASIAVVIPPVVWCRRGGFGYVNV